MAAKRRKLTSEAENTPRYEIRFAEVRIYIVPKRIPKGRVDIIKNAARKKGFDVKEDFDNSITHIVSEYDSKEKVMAFLKRKELVHVELVRLNWLTCCTTEGKPVVVNDDFRIPSEGAEQMAAQTTASPSSKQLPLQDNTSTESIQETKYICQRAAPLIHPNKKFTDALEVLERHAVYTDSSHRDSRALAFRKAACSLKSLPKKVCKIGEVTTLSNIGGHSRRVIQEIIEKGACDEVEDIRSSEFFKAMELFSGIYGCGPATGRKWFEKGFRSIVHIRQAVSEGLKLTEQQRMGVQYYEEVASGVPRAEADAITQIVRGQLDELQPGCTIELVGGYRRGKPSGHDVDILITHPDENKVQDLLSKLVHRLDHLGHMVHKDMSIGKNTGHSEKSDKKQKNSAVGGVMDHLDHCFCMFKTELDCLNPTDEESASNKDPVSRPSFVRRVDLIVAPPSQYPWALLGWTGSKQFNRSLRLYAARELNIAVSNHGAWDQNHVPPRKIEVHNERETFDALQLTYREPGDRNC